MDDGSIYDAVRRRTRKAIGFAVNLHSFRHAALTFWSIHDPKNILGGKGSLMLLKKSREIPYRHTGERLS